MNFDDKFRMLVPMFLNCYRRIWLSPISCRRKNIQGNLLSNEISPIVSPLGGTVDPTKLDLYQQYQIGQRL